MAAGAARSVRRWWRRSPAVAEVLPAERVRAAFENAGRKSQPAWSLLFAALWHGHHIAGVPAEGDIAEVLREAGRRQA